MDTWAVNVFLSVGLEMGLSERANEFREPTVDFELGCCYAGIFACDFDIAHCFYIA